MSPKPLKGCIVGISVSESEELEQLGFDREEMNRFTVRLSEALLSAGARLAFGHDWRPGGVMEAVTALALRHFQISRGEDGSVRSAEAPIINRIASPDVPFLNQVHEVNVKAPALNPMARHLEGVVDARQSTAPRGASRADALTALRRELAQLCDIRVCIGGRTTKYQGKLPGVIEEVLLALQLGKPVLVGGIFGGASGRIILAMSEGKIQLPFLFQDTGLVETHGVFSLARERIRILEEAEEIRLWHSTSVDESIELILRGAVNFWTESRSSTQNK